MSEPAEKLDTTSSLALTHAFSAGWPERAAARSGAKSRSGRASRPAQRVVDAACQISLERGGEFTIQELAKEASVSLQTFYRYFAGRDEVVLAVIEHRIAQACEFLRSESVHITNPVERVRWYVETTLQLLGIGGVTATRKFFAAERYRLQQLYPAEIERAVGAFSALLAPEIRAATEAGQLHSSDSERDARFVTQLVVSTFHNYTFSSEPPPPNLAADVWEFCLTALGGYRDAMPDNTLVSRRSSKARIKRSRLAAILTGSDN